MALCVDVRKKLRPNLRDGGIVLFVDPADPSAVVRAVLELERDPARRNAIAGNARRLVRDRYNWQAQVAHLIDLYAGLDRRGRKAS